jgi:hypothetical protein
MKYFLFLSIFSTLTFSGFGQTTLLKNETLLFTFMTKTGKIMLLSMDKNDNSVNYRFGTAKRTELKFHSDSTHKITYSFYLRGGGPSNEGMDLNYVYFINDGFQYVIFDNYYAAENKKTTGLKIINLKTKETTHIKANDKTIKGNLVQFRDNKVLDIGEELFD